MFSNYKKNFMMGTLASIGVVNARSHSPKVVEYDVNGNELTLMQLSQSASFLSYPEGTEEDDID